MREARPVPPPLSPGPWRGRGTVPYKPLLCALRRPRRLCWRGPDPPNEPAGVRAAAAATSLLPLCPPLIVPFPFSFPSFLLEVSKLAGLLLAAVLGGLSIPAPTQDARGSGLWADAAAAGCPVPGDSGALPRSPEDQEADPTDHSAKFPYACWSEQA